MSGNLILITLLSAAMIALTIMKFEDSVVKAQKSFKALTISKKLSITMPLILTGIMWLVVGFNYAHIKVEDSNLLKAFNNDQTLQCSINKTYGYSVSKKRGWSYSQDEGVFIKDDLFISKEICKLKEQ